MTFTKCTIVQLTLLSLSFLTSSSFSGPGDKKKIDQPPKPEGFHYRWCQSLTEDQIQRRKQKGKSAGRDIGKEEGKTENHQKLGPWKFWDKQGKLMAEGNCDSMLGKNEPSENGLWSYWDEQGRKITLEWTYGKFDHSTWVLYDDKQKQRWKVMLQTGEPFKVLLEDKKYVSQLKLESGPNTGKSKTQTE